MQCFENIYYEELFIIIIQNYYLELFKNNINLSQSFFHLLYMYHELEKKLNSNTKQLKTTI